MIFEFKFADIGEGVHEGEILQWHVKKGDYVKEEQLLVEVLTEKVTVEITSPVSGIIVSLEGRNEGDIITVGEILAKIDTEKSIEMSGDIQKAEVIEVKDDSLFTAAAPFKHVQPKESESRKIDKRALAAPSIRREARERNIDLHKVQGSGPGGRITREDFNMFIKTGDVQPALPKQANSIIKGEDSHIPLRGLRRNISKAMRKSKDTATHYTYFEEVDMSALEEIRQKVNSMEFAEKYGIKLSYIPLVIKCLIPALREFPYLNSSLDDDKDEIILKGDINIGIAVNTDAGLVVPVIKNADQKTIWELAREIVVLADKARTGKLSLDEVTGGTFTITSVGNIGGFAATPIIRWPEVAILGLMRKKLRPVVIENYGKPEIAIRPVMMLSLTIDHRVVDGAVAAMFTNTLTKYMENPALLLFNENDF
ncbi:MAG: dihydrolipoamide acetyltransferase family protein [Candidatus Hodarchaeota archaeon]